MEKTVVIHDLPEEKAKELVAALAGEVYLFSAAPEVKHCIGCFACWTKTPGICVIKDRHQALPPHMAMAGRLVVVSRCAYGCYAPAVKKVLDRCIGYILPYFYVDKVRNEMHHVPRYKKQAEMRVCFYGDINADERRTAERLVAGNGVNLNMKSASVYFFQSYEDIRTEHLKLEAAL